MNWLLCPWDFPGNNTGVGSPFLFKRIFLTQGSNLHLLYWQAGSLPLSHLGSPRLQSMGSQSRTQLSTCVYTVHPAGQMLPGSSLLSSFIPQTFTEQSPCAQGRGRAVSTICPVPGLRQGPVCREQVLLFLSLCPCCPLPGCLPAVYSQGLLNACDLVSL